MQSEKVATSGWVTIECLEDVVGGYNTVLDIFRESLAKWAEGEGWVLLPGTHVFFKKPSLDDEPPLPKMIKVLAVGRAVRVTKLPQVFSQGAINLC